MGNPTDTSPRHRLRRGRTLLVGVLVLGGSLTAAIAGSSVTAHAASPGVGTPTVVTVGDSYISGEAGRWAGNSESG